jgi:hypothetical protein
MSNLAVTPGTGATVAAELIGGVLYSQAKLIDSTAASTTPIGTSSNPLPVVQTGTPGLPTGASTSALQTTGNSYLSTLATNSPALGQALAAASVPVVMTAAQVSTLTPPTNTGYALDASLTTIDTDLKSNITLHAGSNLVGKVGLDQTTNGTTNGVFTVPGTLASGVTSAMTGTTSTAVISGTASNYLYITQITVANSHATVSTMINFQDGSGGTTIYSVPAAAVFGGATITFPKDAPLKVPTSGNGLYCANVTTGSNTYVSASGWKSTTSY